LPETLVYGGQAVIEGVMMRSPTHVAIAVRKPDGEIVVDRRRVVTYAARHKWARFPGIRGIFALIEALGLGMSALNYSAEIAAAAEAEKERRKAAQKGTEAQGPDHAEAAVERDSQAGKKRAIPAWLMVGNVIVSLAIFLGIFIYVPTLAAGYIVPQAERAWVLANAVEGGIRLLLVVGYMAGISLWGPIRRIFHYHGAEHQVINAYEAGEPPTVEAAAAHSPLHGRCGTTFLVVVILLKIVAGVFVGWPSLAVRGLLRLALLFPVASIAYEVTKLAAKYPDNLLVRAIIAPGMWIQRLTARPATPDMLAVSVRAFEAVQSDTAQLQEPAASVAAS
jgi:uncharacterized protein YqhQ